MKDTNREIMLGLGAIVGTVALAVVALAVTSGPSRDAGDPHYSANRTAQETTVTNDYPAPDPGEYRDPAALTDLPYSVQVYTRMARGLVQNGTVPRSRVTPAFVQADVFREYGIELNAAQAEFVVNEITR